MKYKCTLNYPKIESIIEADDTEEAELRFWKENNLDNLEAWLIINEIN